MHKKAIFLIILVVVIGYGNTLFNDFSADDFIAIADNKFIQSWKNFPRLFKKDYLTDPATIYLKSGTVGDFGTSELTYRPIVTFSNFIDYSIWKSNPFGYHLTKFLLHLANCILLYLLLVLILKEARIALWASLFFAAHPVYIELINSCSLRGDLFAMLFYLIAFISFIQYRNYKGIKKSLLYTASIISYFLGVFSKEMAVTLPLMLVLYDYYFTYDGKIKNIFSALKSRYLGYIIVTIFYLYIYFCVFRNPYYLRVSYIENNLYIHFLTVIKTLALYIVALFIPLNIGPLPSEFAPVAHSLVEPQTLFSLGLILLSFIAGFKSYKNSKAISFAIFWFFITLIPASNFIPLLNKMAYRYLYIPSVGFFIIYAIFIKYLTGFIELKASPYIKQSRKLIIGGIVAFYLSIIIPQNMFWKNNYTFNANMIRLYPSDNALNYSVLGDWYLSKGMLIEAMINYKFSLSKDPTNPLPYLGLGVVYSRLGKFDKTIEEFKKPLKFFPDFAKSYFGIGVTYAIKKDYKKALAYFKTTIKIDPFFVEAYDNLAQLYIDTKQFKKAESTLRKALELAPDYKPLQDKLKKLQDIKNKEMLKHD